MTDDGQHDVNERSAAPQPIGIWVSAVANALGICAGAVFLFARAGARFRGMEPEAQAFAGILGMAVALGLLAGLPASLYDVFWRRCRLWGSAGALLSLTPWPVALLVSELVAEQKGILFD
jgi:hypothetical protein